MSLFRPEDPVNSSRLFRFLHEVNERHGLGLGSYQDLYHWSITNNDYFWSHVWDHTRIIGSKGRHVVDTAAAPAENPAWFSDSALNFSENLLSNRCPDTTAIVQVCTFYHSIPLEALGNQLPSQQSQLPRTPILRPSSSPTHSSTHSWQTPCPRCSSVGLSPVTALRHIPPIAL